MEKRKREISHRVKNGKNKINLKQWIKIKHLVELNLYQGGDL